MPATGAEEKKENDDEAESLGSTGGRLRCAFGCVSSVGFALS